MNQFVRVALVFPRSGQQVYVSVPPQVAHIVDSRRPDHMLYRSEHSTTNVVLETLRTSDGRTHPQ